MAYLSGNGFDTQSQLADITYLGKDQRSEFEAHKKNFVCQADCHAEANVCLQQNAGWRQQPLEATKDCMSNFAECKTLCRGV